MARTVSQRNAQGTRSWNTLETVLVFIVVFCATAAIALWIFRSYPFSQDEYTYLYQAQIFASGRMYLHLAPQLSQLAERYMIVTPSGRMFSKYPPLFSAILALGVLAKNPALINPIISAITATVLFLLLRKRTTTRVALLSAAIVASNSYFLGYGASFFTQPLTCCLVTCGLYFLALHMRRPRYRFVVAAAAMVAACFILRELDALCLLLALTVGLAYGRHEDIVKRLAILWAVSGVGILLLLAYNYMLVGKITIATYPIWNFEFKVMDAGSKSFLSGATRVAASYVLNVKNYMTEGLFRHYLFIVGPLFIVLVILGAMRKPDRLTLACMTFIVLSMLLYVFHPTLGWMEYGLRYWYDGFGAMAILAGLGLMTVGEKGGNEFMVWFAAFVLLTQSIILAVTLQDYEHRFRADAYISRQINQQCPRHSFVVLKATPIIPFVQIGDFKRNPFFGGPRLFLGNLPNLDVKQQYPHYPVCHFHLSRLPPNLQ